MLLFRTRKIKTKYNKIKKKKAQILHNKAVALSKKNWVISNTRADVLPFSQTVSYINTFNNSTSCLNGTIRSYNSLFKNNSFPFLDNTVKLFPVFQKGLQFFSEHFNLHLLKLKAFRFYKNGVVFYCASLSVFFKKMRNILCNSLLQFSVVFCSINQFAYNSSLLPQDGLYVIVYCKNEDPNTINLFFSLFLAMQEDKSFFAFDDFSFVFLGFFFFNVFYNIYSLLSKLAALHFFFTNENSGLLHNFHLWKELKNIIMDQQDSELFLEADTQEDAVRIQLSYFEQNLLSFKESLVFSFDNQFEKTKANILLLPEHQSDIASFYFLFSIIAFSDIDLTDLESFFYCFIV